MPLPPLPSDWLWSCRCGSGGVSDSQDETRRLAALHLTNSVTTTILSVNPSAHGLPIVHTHQIFIGPVMDSAQLPAPTAEWKTGWRPDATGCAVSHEER